MIAIEARMVTQYQRELSTTRTPDELQERWLDVEDANQFFHVIDQKDVEELRTLFSERLSFFERAA